MPDHALKPAVFLDRDGTITEEVGYLNHISRLRLLEGAAGAIRLLNDARLPVIVVTNQSGVGRGYFPEQLVRDVHKKMIGELQSLGARVDGVYYCPHVASDNCECRKPKPGMLRQAADTHRVDLGKSFVVGDRRGDVDLASQVSARSVLVRTGYGEGELAWHLKDWPIKPDFIALDLPEAVRWILQELRG